MYEQDACAQAMGMDIIDMDEGYAVVTTDHHPRRCLTAINLPWRQLFSLADTALPTPATARGLAAVASGCTIDFLRPGFVGTS